VLLDRGVRREDDLRASGTRVAGNEEERGRQRYLSLSSAHDSAEQRAISLQHDLRSLSNKFQLELQPGPIGTVQAARLQDAVNTLSVQQHWVPMPSSPG
jgi:hypothetical protein